MPENNEHIDLFELAGKYFDDTLSVQESAQLEDLLKTSEHRHEFEALKQIWNTPPAPSITVDTEKALLKVNTKIEHRSVKDKQTKTRNLKPYFAVAASVAILVVAFFVTNTVNLFTNTQTLAFIADSTGMELDLTDGSQIAVNQGSTITYPETFDGDTREVTLSGQAFFSIERDETKPFIVHTPYADVHVLGTSFYVHAHPDSTSVSVTVETGKVRVISTLDKNISTTLTPGEAITYEKSEQTMTKESAKPDNGFWRSRLLRFKREELSKVVRIVNKYYSGTLVVTPEIETCKLTASFEDKSLEEIVAIISGTLELSVEYSADSIYLHGQACN